MAFKIRKAADVTSGIVEELRRAGISFYGENARSRAIAKIQGREIQNLSEFFDQNFDKAFLQKADGALLEAIAFLFGLRREEATKAKAFSYERSLEFYVADGNTFGSINSGVSFTIPAGTSIWSRSITNLETTINYVTATPIVCGVTATSAYGNIEAELEGTSSNVGAHVLVNHDFVSYGDYVNESLLVRNSYPIISGQDRQTDDELRFALSIAATASEAGNLSAIRLALLSIPGLVDMKLINYFDGIGSIGAFVVGQDNECTTSMLEQGQYAITDRSSNAILATVYAPPQVGVSFRTKVNLSEPITVNQQNEIEAKLKDIVTRYFLSHRIGEALNTSRLIGNMYAADNRIVSFGTSPEEAPFDYLHLYRTSIATGERVRNSLITSITSVAPKEHEVIILEHSLANPVLFTWEVFE